MPRAMDDVLVIGGGVIGCAAALALARRGAHVTVLEQRPLAGALVLPGPGGSSAAAGILGAQLEAHSDGPMARLCIASRARYAAWASEIVERSGLDVELRHAGVMRVAFDEGAALALAREVAWQERAGLRVEHLDGEGARALEPALARDVVGGVRLPDDPRIDPPSLLAALRAAVTTCPDAAIRATAGVRRVLVQGGRAGGIELMDGETLRGGAIVVAAGSWSALVENSSLRPDAVQPARGQIVELALPSQPLRGVIDGPACYLSPRDDGRVLVGATVEFAGFSASTTAAAVRDLLVAATRLVPALEGAAVRRAWAGLRPYTRDELPLIGASGIERLFIATGHFRNGVLLAPITGEIIAALVTGEAQPADGIDVAAFSPLRLAATPSA